MAKRLTIKDLKEKIDQLRNDQKEQKPKKINVSILIGVLTILSMIIANQLVQPFFNPRVSDYDRTDLYIQSLGDGKEAEYYLISKLTYKIDIPLLPLFRNVPLGLVEARNSYGDSKIDLICHMTESAPYLDLNLQYVCNNTNFKKIEDIDFQINAKVLTNGFIVKNIKANLYLRELIPRVMESHVARSDHYWYSNSMLNPIDTTIDLVSVGKEQLGIGISGKNNITYKFEEIIVKSNTNLKIKGYKVKVDLNPNVYNVLCHEGIRLFTEGTDGEYISLDLEPVEMKRILLIEKADYWESLKEEMVTFEFKGYNFCSDGWRKYIEYFRS